MYGAKVAVFIKFYFYIQVSMVFRKGSKYNLVYFLCLSKAFSALATDISKPFRGLHHDFTIAKLITHEINLRATKSI